VIHYHGSPITPANAAAKVLAGRHSFVSFANPEQLPIAVEVCQSFALDNGAFSAWMAGKPIEDWQPYYAFVESYLRCPSFDFAVVPDVIDGDEDANDELADAWPHPRHLSAVVWHMHESIERLHWMAQTWPRVAIGSSGEFATVGTPKWWNRINQAMNAICIDGQPVCKLHGLRMLDPDVFTRLPFSSADSTSVARGIGIDNKWSGSYVPPDKDWKACVLAARIESHNAASHWISQPEQEELCLF
jgi:hypothetical protein